MSRGSARVVVVGGGISGLAAAVELLSLGVDGADVTVLEAAAATGGLLRAARVGDVVVDVGAEAMLARRSEGVGLAGDVGVAGQIVSPGPARPAVWRATGVRPLPAGTVMGVPGTATDLTQVLQPDELRVTERALAAARQAGAGVDSQRATEPGSDVDVASAVLTDVGRPVLDLLVEPLLGGVYAGRTDRLSLRSTVPVLGQAHAAGEPLAAAVDRLGVAATAGVPVFAGIDGGMARLATAATSRLLDAGVEVRRDTRVTGLIARPGGWRLTTTSSGHVAGAVEDHIDADLVVLALPTTTTARLLADAVPDGSRQLSGVDVASVAVVALAVPGPRPSTSGLLVPPVEATRAGVTVKAVTFSSTKWAWVGEQDEAVTVLRASVGRVGESVALQRDDDALVSLVRRDLTTLLGADNVAALASAPATVARWGGALPQYAPGHELRVAALLQAVAAVGGLAVTGGFLDGVGVPACIASARHAVHGLLHPGGDPPPVPGRLVA